MAFVNFSLLLGGVLVAIPIVLHLVMRQKPKQLEFPALRFVKKRQAANRRRLELRHWLLLALRCGVIAVAALALARPSVASAALGSWLVVGAVGAICLLVALLAVFALLYGAGKLVAGGLAAAAALLLAGEMALVARTLHASGGGLIGDQEAPVAAALVIDTSPRMQYRHLNQTRLDQARETAVWLLRQFPDESDVAIVESRGGGAVFSVDRAAARKTLDGLGPATLPLPLETLVRDAVELLKTSDKTRKELYILSDLTAAAWPVESAATLQAALADADRVSLYVIDVGVDDPRNFALGELNLSSQTLAKNSELTIQAELWHQGPGGTRDVELYLEDQDPDLPVLKDGKLIVPPAQRRRRETCTLAENGSQLVAFDVPGLGEGTHHGWIKIVGEDGLAWDDVRHFTVEVRPAWPVLVVAPQGVNTSLLVEALAPFEFRESGQARFRCDVVPVDQLSGRQWSQYAAVVLVDPADVAEDTWRELAAYVERGGGVAVLLGHNALGQGTLPRSALIGEAALSVLPAELGRQYSAPAEPLFLAPPALGHPLLARFRAIGSSLPWFDLPVYKYWSLKRLLPGSAVVVPYSNNRPAIVERSLGRGRVLMTTTPWTDPTHPAGRQPWNMLPTGFEPWPYVMLTNEMFLYLVGSGQTKLNYLAGETAVLPEHGAEDLSSYLLFLPDGGKPQLVTARDGNLTVKFTDAPGAYRLKASRGGAVRGFAVNLPDEASRLERAPSGRLDQVLGQGRYKLAKSREEIVRDVGEARVGREFFPLLLLGLALFLGLEHTLASRFYRKKS